MAVYSFARTIYVPAGRTYVIREFRFIPSKIFFDANFDIYPNFYEYQWQVSGIVQGDAVAIDSPQASPINYLDAAGTRGYMSMNFLAPQFSVVTLNIRTFDIPDNVSPGVTLSAVVNIRVDNLLDDARPLPQQIGNRHEELELHRLQGQFKK